MSQTTAAAASIASLLLLLCCFSSTVQAQPVNWSTLTATTLANLTLAQVASATSTNLGSIPAQACTGWQQPQFTQIGQPCEGFQNACLSAITVNALGGMTASCMAALSSGQIESFNAKQIGGINPVAFSGISEATLFGLTTGCSGLTAPQLGQITTCGGIQSQCVMNIPAPTFANLTANCASEMPASAFSIITQAQLGAIDVTIIGTYNSSIFMKLTDSVCAGFTPQQTAYFGLVYDSACSGISAGCWSQISALAMGQLAGYCVAAVTVDGFSKINMQQFGALDPNSLYFMTAGTFGGMNGTACWGFTTTQLAVLQFDTCIGFSSACITSIPPPIMSAFQPVCFSNIAPASFQAFSVPQIAMIAPATIAAMTSQQMAQLNNQCEGFNSTQAAQFSAGVYQSTCSGIQPGCMMGFSSSVLNALQPLCITWLPIPSITGLFAQQFSQLTNAGAGLTAAQITALQFNQCNSFQPNQIATLQTMGPFNQCSGFKRACLQQIPSASTSTFLGSCLRNIPTAEITGLSLDQLNSLSPNGIIGLTEDQLYAFWTISGRDFIDLWTVTQANAISSATMATWITKYVQGKLVSTDENWLLNATTIDLKTKSQFQLSDCQVGCLSVLYAATSSPNTLPVLSWQGMRSDLVAQLGPGSGQIGSIAWLTLPTAWIHWPQAAIAALSSAQVAALPNNVVTVIDPSFYSAQGITGLTDQAIQTITPAQWVGVGCTNLAALTSHQLSVLGAAYPNLLPVLQAQCGITNSSSSSSSGPAGSTGMPSSTASPIIGSSSSSSGSVDPGSPSGPGTGLIVGLVIGGLVGAVLISVLCWWIYKRVQANRQNLRGLDEQLLP